MKKHSKYPMTEQGKEKLENELAYLASDKREEVISRIKKARSFCDFSEDSEFEEALKEQAAVEKRIALLKDMIYRAEIIQSNAQDEIVSIGKTVTFIEQPSNNKETYKIVGLAEADPLKGMISDQSPLATSLLGKKINDEVSVSLPGGQIKVKIINII